MNAQQAANIWLQRAESNFRLAQVGKAEAVFFEDLCFEAEQAAEKALKAVLIHRSHEYPKTHSLGLLIELIEQYVGVSDAVRAAVALSNYAVQTRYPGDYSPVSEEEYEQALILAQTIVSWARQQIERG
ncbi:MAG: HEPN domain-containing protein [Anaerolineae bacterium]